MKKSSASPQILDIFPGVMELAQLLKSHPRHLDKEKIKRGDELLIFFEDASFKITFKGLRQQKIKAIETACRDIAEGGEVLQSATIGVTFQNGKMQHVVFPLGGTPPGNIVFSVGWRAKRAFHGWRSEGGNEVTQDDVNALLYRLAHLLSQTIAG